MGPGALRGSEEATGASKVEEGSGREVSPHNMVGRDYGWGTIPDRAPFVNLAGKVLKIVNYSDVGVGSMYEMRSSVRNGW